MMSDATSSAIGALRVDAFLSYNARDKTAVDELAGKLEKDGITLWLDSSHLLPGTSAVEKIEEALAKCESFVVFLSDSGLGPWQRVEVSAAVDAAINRKKPRLIPVILPGAREHLPNVVPPLLRHLVRIEFKSIDDAQSYRLLKSGILGRTPGLAHQPTGTDEHRTPRKISFVLSCLVTSFNDKAFLRSMAEALRIDVSQMAIVTVRPRPQGSTEVSAEGEPDLIRRIIDGLESVSARRALAKATGLTKINWQVGGQDCEMDATL